MRISHEALILYLNILAFQAISGEFFPDAFEFVDLFLPSSWSSESRARAFLWLIYRFHEGAHLQNPFDDDYAHDYPGRAPLLRRLSEDAYRRENIDEPAEIEWGKKMAHQRSVFLQDLVSGGEGSRDRTKHVDVVVKAQQVQTQVSQDRHHNAPPLLQHAPSSGPPRGDPNSHSSSPAPMRSGDIPMSSRRGGARPHKHHHYTSDVGAGKQPTFHHYIPANARPPKPVHEGPPRVSAVLTAQRREPEYRIAHRRSRTMFQQAWHRVQTRDALYDSDNEENLDEDARWDYHQRSLILRAISTRM